AMTFITNRNRIGRVIQDVVTHPPFKVARVQGERGLAEWICGGVPGADILKVKKGTTTSETLFPKTRPDDFYREIQYFDAALDGRVNWETSPLNVRRGLETMAVIAAAHVSHKSRRTQTVDYDAWRITGQGT
ncbi:MAG TPA: hypothetical protein VJL08_01530, partial [Dehalococcoidia bacterium]|nr:hypothetical protein [Dehalococcoidia bacterium]